MTEAEIDEMPSIAEDFEQIIFISYNSSVFKSQIKLFNKLKYFPILTIIGGNAADKKTMKTLL